MSRPFKYAILLFLVMILPVTVLAHPGRTDSQGGHTDHSTGEYHYHHGYSAHQHYDMDGDGKADCPYDFKDKTDHTTGSGDSALDITVPKPSIEIPDFPEIEPPKVTFSDPVQVTPEKEGAKVVLNLTPIVNWIIAGILVILAICCYFLKRRCTEAQEKITDIQNKYDTLKKWTVSGIISYRKRVAEYQEKLLVANDHWDPDVKVNFRSASNIPMYEEHKNASDPFFLPDGVFVGASGKLVCGYVCNSRPYGDFTVYVSNYGSCFHSTSFCSHTTLRPAHIMDVISTKRPCTICCGHDLERSKPEWYINFVRASSAADINWQE